MRTLLKTEKASEADFWNTLFFGLLLFAAVLMLLTCVGQGQETPLNSIRQKRVLAVRKHKVVVSIPDRKLVLLEEGKVRKVYPVAIGTTATPTPSGSFRVISRVNAPTYYHAGKVIGPGPSNPIGTRWIGLSAKGYGIHGTNAPKSIGKAASHGCVRMSKQDLEELFEILNVGDEVEIHDERDAQLAAFFDADSQTSGTASGSAPANGEL